MSDGRYYRFVRPFDWYEEPGKPGLKSSAFKDGAGGYSVDAECGRAEDACVARLRTARSAGQGREGIVRFPADVAAVCGVDVIDDERRDNPYHRMFVDDREATPPRVKRAAKCLQKVAEVVATF